jgi:hypothetical protein
MKRALLVAVFLAALSAAVAATAQDANSHPLPHAAPADTPSGPDVVTVKLCLYRVQGDVSGKMSLTDNVREGIDGDKVADEEGPYRFFTLADLTVAGVRLQADQNGWKWDGKDEPPSGSRVEQIAAPQLVVKMPDAFRFEVTSNVPIQYFRKRADALFELAQVDRSTGLIAFSRVEKGAAGRILLRNFTINTRVVEKRKPIEGVTLDVGEPVVSTTEKKFTIAVKPDLDYGVLFSSKGAGFLLLRLKLSFAKPVSDSRTEIHRNQHQ